MKLINLLHLLGLLATIGFTTATPVKAATDKDFNEHKFQHNIEKWNKGKSLATEVIDLIASIGQDEYHRPDGHGKLTSDDFDELVKRYFGSDSDEAVKNIIFPMFARMQEGLNLGHDGPLKYRFDEGKNGFTGSALTAKDEISFANLALIDHSFVNKVPERARVWIHEMSHLSWVNGGLGDNGVHDTPTSAIQYSSHSLKSDAKPLGSIYGETLSQYLAYCYPNMAPFNSDNVARWAMAVHHAAEEGHKPGKEDFKHKCPRSQGKHPRLNLANVPQLSPKLGEPVEHVSEVQRPTMNRVEEEVIMPVGKGAASTQVKVPWTLLTATTIATIHLLRSLII